MKTRPLSAEESKSVIEALTALGEAAVPDLAKLTGIDHRRIYSAFKALQQDGKVYKYRAEIRGPLKLNTRVWKATQPRKAETYRALFEISSKHKSTAEFLDALEEIFPSCANGSSYYTENTVKDPVGAMRTWLAEATGKGLIALGESQEALHVLRYANTTSLVKTFGLAPAEAV